MAQAPCGRGKQWTAWQLLACCLLVTAFTPAHAIRHPGASNHSQPSHAKVREPQMPSPPTSSRGAVGKLLSDSIRMLKGSLPRPPPPSRGPPLDCAKHPGLCQPDTCEVWRPDIKDKCRYVRDKDACGADDQYIPYLELFYCASGKLWLLVSIFLVVWLLLLFYAMSIVAEVFLCPAVQHISERLKLPPDIAGVTLLAFASGAPDVFTEIAAINGGHAVELELAVSSVMGSGLFICCVSLAGVLCVKGIDITDRTAFIRDVAAYLAAVAVTLAMLWDGAFSRIEAIVLILLYVLYLCVCVYTSRGGTPVAAVHHHTALPSSSPRVGRRSSEPELQLADASAFVTLNCNGGTGALHASGKAPGAAERRLAAGDAKWDQLPGSDRGAADRKAAERKAAENVQQNGHARVPAAVRRAPVGASPKAVRLPGTAGAAAPQNRFAAARRLADPAQHVLDGSNGGSSRSGGSVLAGSSRSGGSALAGGSSSDGTGADDRSACESPLPVSTDLEFPVAAAAVAAAPWTAGAGLQPPRTACMLPGHLSGSNQAPTNSLLSCCGGGGCLGRLGARISGVVQQSAAAARAVCAEHLHLGGSWQMDAVVVLTAPLVLLMHATMPAVGRGQSSHRYCVMLAAAAPAFSLLIAGGLRLGLLACAAIWGAAAAALYATMHCVILRGEGSGRSIPKANAVFAALAFGLSAAWLGTIADEVVAVLNGVGAILGIEEDLLGATVLAWGETLPDLVAMLAVARAGQGTMAIAACFGAPVLNLLMGTGAPALGASFKHGGVLPFKLSHGIVLLHLETVVLCATLLALVPTVCGWTLRRRAAWLLLGTYLVFQLLFLAAEQHWLL